MSIRKRVFTYITFTDQLLVLDHVHYPDLFRQIPGGTIEAGESPAEVAMREAEEETGLLGLKLKSFLGDFGKDLSSLGKEETVHAYFYHLEVTGQPPLRWRHSETDPHGAVEPILFELYWVNINPKPMLGGIDDAKYDELIASLHCNAA